MHVQLTHHLILLPGFEEWISVEVVVPWVLGSKRAPKQVGLQAWHIEMH
jgi:hypothetical protein